MIEPYSVILSHAAWLMVYKAVKHGAPGNSVAEKELQAGILRVLQHAAVVALARRGSTEVAEVQHIHMGNV